MKTPPMPFHSKAKFRDVAGCCESVAGMLLLKCLAFNVVADVASFSTSHIVCSSRLDDTTGNPPASRPHSQFIIHNSTFNIPDTSLVTWINKAKQAETRLIKGHQIRDSSFRPLSLMPLCLGGENPSTNRNLFRLTAIIQVGYAVRSLFFK
jgi:hypothetical protein